MIGLEESVAEPGQADPSTRLEPAPPRKFGHSTHQVDSYFRGHNGFYWREC